MDAEPVHGQVTPDFQAAAVAGGRRDRRRFAAVAIAGVTLAGLIVTFLLLVPRPSGPIAVATAASSPWGTCTEQVTLDTARGQMSACIDYRYEHKRLEILRAGGLYVSDSGYDLPYFRFVFRDPSSGMTDYVFSSPRDRAENVYSHKTALFNLVKKTRGIHFHSNDALEVSAWATSAHTGKALRLASVILTLYPRGFQCPSLDGTGNGEVTGQC
jgi:hypothetical protein